jgi:ATP-binding cassette, subfamily B, bacterial
MSGHQMMEEEFTGRLDWKVWRRLLSFGRPYRRHFAVLGVAGATMAMCDAFFGVVMRGVLDEIASNGAAASLGSHLLAYAALTGTIVLCIWAFIRAAGRLTTVLAHDIRRDAFGKLQQLELAWYDRRPVGWILTRVTSDCDRLSRQLGWLLLDLVWGACLLGTITAIMLVLDPRLALAVLAIVPALILVSRAFQKRLLKTSRTVRRTASEITAAFNEGIVGVRTTKSLVREEQSLAELQRLSGKLYTASLQNATLSALYLPVVLAIVSAGSATALALGAQPVLAGALSVGTLVLFLRYANQLVDPIQELAQKLTEFLGAQAAAERVAGLLATEPGIQDSEAVRRAVQDGSLRAPERIGRIELRGVGFV